MRLGSLALGVPDPLSPTEKMDGESDILTDTFVIPPICAGTGDVGGGGDNVNGGGGNDVITVDDDVVGAEDDGIAGVD